MSAHTDNDNDDGDRQPLIVKSRRLTTIISGGQTGADRAALEAAFTLGLKTGGLAPPGFMTSAGKAPELGYKFSLKEMYYDIGIHSAMAYALRSKANVDRSDATLAFRLHPSPGTDRTIGYCLTKRWTSLASLDEDHPHPYKPVLIISNSVQKNDAIPLEVWQEDKRRLLEFLQRHNIQTLNVAGHRQDSSDPTWQERIRRFLLFALEN